MAVNREAKETIRRLIDNEWLDEDSKEGLRKTWGVTDENMTALREGDPGDLSPARGSSAVQETG